MIPSKSSPFPKLKNPIHKHFAYLFSSTSSLQSSLPISSSTSSTLNEESLLSLPTKRRGGASPFKIETITSNEQLLKREDIVEVRRTKRFQTEANIVMNELPPASIHFDDDVCLEAI